MPVPETTSVENLFRYVGGKCLATGRGEAWREIKASVIALPPVVDALHMPSVSEPVLVWITSGEVEVQGARKRWALAHKPGEKRGFLPYHRRLALRLPL
jgi:hypothetical protein